MNWQEKFEIRKELQNRKNYYRAQYNHYIAISSINSNYSEMAKNVFKQKAEELQKQIENIKERLKELE